jgi:hypothetical protein
MPENLVQLAAQFDTAFLGGSFIITIGLAYGAYRAWDSQETPKFIAYILGGLTIIFLVVGAGSYFALKAECSRLSNEASSYSQPDGGLGSGYDLARYADNPHIVEYYRKNCLSVR